MKPRTLALVTIAAVAVLIAVLLFAPREAPASASAAIDVAGQPVKGNPAATVMMVVFEDFRCPACQNFELNVMPDILRDYVDGANGRVQIAYMNLPVVNPVSAGEHVARIGECVFAQNNDAFWAMKTPLYRAQGELSDARRAVELAKEYAPGIDGGLLDACLADPASLASVRADAAKAVELQVRATPTVFVNGTMVSPATLANVRTELDRALGN